MTTPAYILRLREHVGHDLLLLPGASGVVRDVSFQTSRANVSRETTWP